MSFTSNYNPNNFIRNKQITKYISRNSETNDNENNSREAQTNFNDNLLEISEIEKNKKRAMAEYIFKLDKLIKKGILNETMKQKKLALFQQLINIEAMRKLNKNYINNEPIKSLYKKLLIETNLSFNPNNIKVNINNLNNIRYNNYYKDKIRTGNTLNFEWMTNRKKQKKFSYNMNLENPIHSEYDIIYYFILKDYIINNFNDKRMVYIFKHIKSLSPEEKKNLCLLILKKITQQKFLQFCKSKYYGMITQTYNKNKTVFNLMNTIESLIIILEQMGPKYFKTLSYVRKLIKSFVNNYFENDDQYLIDYPNRNFKSLIFFHLRRIEPYISEIKKNFIGNKYLDFLGKNINNSKEEINNSKEKINKLLIKIGLYPKKVNMTGNKTYNGRSLSLAIKETLKKNYTQKKLLEVRKLLKILGFESKDNDNSKLVNDPAWTTATHRGGKNS